MFSFDFSLILITLFCLALGPAYLYLNGRQRRTQAQRQTNERLQNLSQKINSALQESIELDPCQNFDNTMRAASLITDLQRPRLQAVAGISKGVPEKYRILGKLAAHGLGSEEIASILGISGKEAVQLLNLYSMAGSAPSSAH